MKRNCKTYARLSDLESERMDELIDCGFAFNRSEFTRLAIRHYISFCERSMGPDGGRS